MRRAWLVVLTVPLYAQSGEAVALNGSYHFVRVATSGEGAREVRVSGGTLTFAPDGTYRHTGHVGIGSAASFAISGEGTYASAGGTLRLSDLSEPGATFEVLPGLDGSVLLGTGAEDGHGFFLAARAAEAGITSLQGNYAGALLAFQNGVAGGVSTAFLELRANGGMVTPVSLVRHAGWIDDVNRLEQPSSEFLTGERQFFAAAEGEILLAYGTAAGSRDILVALRIPADASTTTLRGRFDLADFCAANSYVFAPDRVRWNSGLGSASADGDGNLALSENVWTSTRRIELITSGQYRIQPGGTGQFGPQVDFTLKNLAIGTSGGIFLAAQVGPPGELSLTHGLMVGVRSVRTVQPGVYLAPRGVFNAASLAPQLPRIAPGSMVSLFGSNLSASQTAASTTPIPAELGGVRVLLNGAAAPLLFASSQQVNFLVPWELAPGAVSIQVDNNGSLSNPARATVGSTSPAVFSMAGPGSPILAFHADSTLVSRLNPARPGETLVAYANGLGPVAPEVRSGDTTPLTGLSRVVGNLEILIDGRPARVDFAGLAPGMVDVYQLNFVIPEDITGYREVTLAIGTSDAFSDLAEIAVAPR